MLATMTWGLVAILAVAGGIWRRFLGGWHTPQITLKRSVLIAVWFLAVGFGLVAGGIHPAHALAVAALTSVGWSLGHGSYVDLGRMPGKDNEHARHVLDIIFRNKTVSSWLRDASGLVLTYGSWTLVGTLLLVVSGRWLGLLGLLLGPLTVAAYEAGWRLVKPRDEGGPIDGPLAVGEILVGMAVAGWLAAAAFIRL